MRRWLLFVFLLAPVVLCGQTGGYWKHPRKVAGPVLQAGLHLPNPDLRVGLTSWWNLDEASGTRLGSEILTVSSGSVGSEAGADGLGATFVNTAPHLVSGNTTLGLSGPFTISFWFKCPADAYGMILSKTNQIWVDAALGEINLFFGSDYAGVTLPSYTASQWNSVVVWWDGKTTYASLNGAAAVTGAVLDGTTNAVPVFASSPFRIGSDEFGGYELEGAVDEVYMWNRVLTSSERARLATEFHPFY